jgi:hypothetical protein
MKGLPSYYKDTAEVLVLEGVLGRAWYRTNRFGV